MLDLGANMGEFSTEIANNHQCKPTAVEPLPSLCSNALHYAIAGQAGTVKLKTEPHRCASILGPGLEVEVQTITVDCLLKQLELTWVDLVKVDIEGAEIEMFDSLSTDSLNNFGQITIEFHDRWFPELIEPVKRVRKRLSSHFHEIRFSMDNTDVLYINPKLPISSFDLLCLRCPIKYSTGVRRRIMRNMRTNT